MIKQEYFRNKYKGIKTKWKDSTEIYHDLISNLVSSDTYLLDVGCGHSGLLSEIYSRTNHTYGIEPDLEARRRNTYIKNIYNCYVEDMPFKDNLFDVVICAWVLEHLDNPIKAFKEIYRVLKPGGKVIFITPNILNYNVWIIRLIPEKLHDYLTKKLYNRQENDTFKKKYLINSPKRIETLLSTIGYRKIRLFLNGDPSYISFNNATFFIALLIEKLIDLKVFNQFRVHIIGEYQKPV